MSETLSLDEIEALSTDCLTRVGVAGDAAALSAAEIASSEAAGERQHGMEALLRDIRLIRYGRIRPSAFVQQTQPSPATLRIDAQHSLATPALLAATPGLVAVARLLGVATLQLEKSSHPGAMITMAKALRDEGMISLCVSAEGIGRFAHPDSEGTHAISGASDHGLSLLIGKDPNGQPKDSPIGAPVSHGAWVLVADPKANRGPLLEPDALEAQLTRPRVAADRVELAPELLEQIVTA